MAGYLTKTLEKVTAIIKGGRVQTVSICPILRLVVVDLMIECFQGMQPTLDTVHS